MARKKTGTAQKKVNEAEREAWIRVVAAAKKFDGKPFSLEGLSIDGEPLDSSTLTDVVDELLSRGVFERVFDVSLSEPPGAGHADLFRLVKTWLEPPFIFEGVKYAGSDVQWAKAVWMRGFDGYYSIGSVKCENTYMDFRDGGLFDGWEAIPMGSTTIAGPVEKPMILVYKKGGMDNVLRLACRSPEDAAECLLAVVHRRHILKDKARGEEQGKEAVEPG